MVSQYLSIESKRLSAMVWLQFALQFREGKFPPIFLVRGRNGGGVREGSVVVESGTNRKPAYDFPILNSFERLSATVWLLLTIQS